MVGNVGVVLYTICVSAFVIHKRTERKARTFVLFFFLSLRTIGGAVDTPIKQTLKIVSASGAQYIHIHTHINTSRM